MNGKNMHRHADPIVTRKSSVKSTTCVANSCLRLLLGLGDIAVVLHHGHHEADDQQPDNNLENGS